MSLISAHRCGVEGDHTLENTRGALERALTLECEYVEFDVQRCRDGVYVLFHDDRIAIDGEELRLDELDFERFARQADQFVRYDEALAILKGRKRAHIDFKFVSPPAAYGEPAATYEVEATAMAVEALGPEQVVITSLEDESVRVVRAWAATQCPELLVGLSLGRDLTGRRPTEILRTRRHELFPMRRIEACGANLVVANVTLAKANLARFASRRSLPLLVWTVDESRELAHWLADARCWMVTTNFPRRATAIRAGESWA